MTVLESISKVVTSYMIISNSHELEKHKTNSGLYLDLSTQDGLTRASIVLQNLLWKASLNLLRRLLDHSTSGSFNYYFVYKSRMIYT